MQPGKDVARQDDMAQLYVFLEKLSLRCDAVVPSATLICA